MKNQFSKKQTIELTQKQFLSLLKVVYLGNWMANANRAKNKAKDYEAIEDLIFSYASSFDLSRFVDHEPSDGDKYFPTRDFEENTDVHKFHEEYDEETFWDELCDRLGERDFYRKYSPEEIRKMSREDYFVKFQKCVTAWEIEMENEGLERLEIVQKSPYYDAK